MELLRCLKSNFLGKTPRSSRMLWKEDIWVLIQDIVLCVGDNAPNRANVFFQLIYSPLLFGDSNLKIPYFKERGDGKVRV